PAPIVERMHKELEAAVQAPETQAKLADLGVTAGDMTQAQLGAFIRGETTKWAKIVKASGASAD
ncbi:MAG: tripartite tricarboxylate transporter substrate binding protein, partial [Ramlibacter sp.]